jgi:Na/Pi-cotransporter
MMNNIGIAITAVGGLALFVYGMGLMSDGLKETAGERLKSALGYMTKNRFFAILAGTIVTGIIQSSSATSVMTVGFVNAGLLTLKQAIGVIFGANIGTTITGQIVSLKLDDIAIPALIVGVIWMMIAKRTATRGIARTILGFGFLFFGMTMMSNELKAFAKLPEFVNFFSLFDCAPTQSGFLPILSVIGAIGVGTICTILVQSSSATIGITIALADAGIINIWTAIPIVLGDNIGTTCTAWLSAIGTSTNAKRTALAHALFNIIGTIILTSTFLIVIANSCGINAPAFFHLVNSCISVDVFAGENLARHVAMAHTLFNVTNVIILTAFIPALAKLCESIIRTKESTHASVLEPKLLFAPALALQASIAALANMTRRSWTVASVALNNSLGNTSVSSESIEAAERTIDEMREQIKEYLVKISQRKLSMKEAMIIPELMHCANDAERISDLALKMYRQGDLSKNTLVKSETMAEITNVASMVRKFANSTIKALKAGKKTDFDTVAISNEIKSAVSKTTCNLWDDPKSRGANTQEFLAVMSVFKCLGDISRHIGNIASRTQFLTGE